MWPPVYLLFTPYIVRRLRNKYSLTPTHGRAIQQWQYLYFNVIIYLRGNGNILQDSVDEHSYAYTHTHPLSTNSRWRFDLFDEQIMWQQRKQFMTHTARMGERADRGREWVTGNGKQNVCFTKKKTANEQKRPKTGKATWNQFGFFFSMALFFCCCLI